MAMCYPRDGFFYLTLTLMIDSDSNQMKLYAEVIPKVKSCLELASQARGFHSILNENPIFRTFNLFMSSGDIPLYRWGLVVTKPVVEVSDKARLIPVSSATETS